MDLSSYESIINLITLIVGISIPAITAVGGLVVAVKGFKKNTREPIEDVSKAAKSLEKTIKDADYSSQKKIDALVDLHEKDKALLREETDRKIDNVVKQLETKYGLEIDKVSKD